MPTRYVVFEKDPRLNKDTDWAVSRKKGFKASIILWGMPRDASILEIRSKLADVGLVGFARGSVVWEGDHIRLVLDPKDSKGLTNEVVSRISACLRKIGCRCVLDENKDVASQEHVELQCANRFKQLSIGVESEEPSGTVCVDVDVVGERMKEVNVFRRERKLRIATWNFSGLCSEREQKEVGGTFKKA